MKYPFDGLPIEVVRILVGLLGGDDDVILAKYRYEMSASGDTSVDLEIRTLLSHRESPLFVREPVERATAGLWAIAMHEMSAAERFKLAETMMERWAEIAASAEKDVTLDEMQAPPPPPTTKRKRRVKS